MTARVLSIDGDLDQILFAVNILASMEIQTGYKVQDMFNYFVGTSLGGFIAMCFAKGKSA